MRRASSRFFCASRSNITQTLSLVAMENVGLGIIISYF